MPRSPCFKPALNEHLKHSAYREISRALRSGEFQRPALCMECGAAPKRHGVLHGHHEDYARPLDVAWLCSKCHRGRHRIPTKHIAFCCPIDLKRDLVLFSVSSNEGFSSVIAIALREYLERHSEVQS